MVYERSEPLLDRLSDLFIPSKIAIDANQVGDYSDDLRDVYAVVLLEDAGDHLYMPGAAVSQRFGRRGLVSCIVQ